MYMKEGGDEFERGLSLGCCDFFYWIVEHNGMSSPEWIVSPSIRKIAPLHCHLISSKPRSITQKDRHVTNKGSILDSSYLSAEGGASYRRHGNKIRKDEMDM
jgi:hypothetical protein